MLIFIQSFHTIMSLFCLIFMILCCFRTHAFLLYNLSYFIMTIYAFLYIFDYLFVILILFHVFNAFVINLYILSCMYDCYMSLFDMTPIAVEYHICISVIYLLFFHYYIYLNISSLQLFTTCSVCGSSFHTSCVSGVRNTDSIYVNKNDSDMIGICETFLNETYLDSEVVIPNYNMFRRDRIGKSGGGIIVYWRDKYDCSRRQDLEPPDIESVWIQLNIVNSQNLLICYIYRPESNIIWYDNFEKQLDKAYSTNKEIILLGDLNIDYSGGCSVQRWSDITAIFNLHQMVEKPTRSRVTNSTATIIDHVYTSKPNFIKEISVPQLGLSDHFPVCITWKRAADSTNTGHRTISCRDLSKFNKSNFCTDISELSIIKSNDVNAKVLQMNIWGTCNQTQLQRLFRFQKRIIRILCNDFMSPSGDLFNQLNIMTIHLRVRYQMCICR